MSSLVHKLGLSAELSWHDVYSLDDPSLLAFVPRPAHALLLVFPVSTAYEKARTNEDSTLPEYSGTGSKEEVLWFKQTIGNACGLMGIIHATCNGITRDLIGIIAIPSSPYCLLMSMSAFNSSFPAHHQS
jgi:ubiquitin carboxyl-terminal hydrolase L3